MPGKVNGFSVAYTVAGGVVLWSGIKGSSLSDTFRSVLAGSTSPPVTQQIAGSSPAATAAVEAGTAPAYAATGNKSAQQALANAAAAYGWYPGPQWQALQSIELREAGFNPKATNPQSGAFGLGQALGHGTAATRGTITNQYGGYGVSDSVAQAANSGDANAQAIWMCAYIKVVYGTPANAWQHEQTHGWY